MPRPRKPEEFPMAAEGVLVLGQLLKAAAFVASGGESKHVIQSGAVRVNGEVEVRRGRRLRPGDVVTVSGRVVRVVERFRLDEPIELVLSSADLTGEWARPRRCCLLGPVSGRANSEDDYCLATLEPPVPGYGEPIGRVILAPHGSGRVWPPSELPLHVYVYRSRNPERLAEGKIEPADLEMLAWCELYEDTDSARTAAER